MELSIHLQRPPHKSTGGGPSSLKHSPPQQFSWVFGFFHSSDFISVSWAIVYPFRTEALAKYNNLHMCIWFMDCFYSCACMHACMCVCVISQHIKYQEKS